MIPSNVIINADDFGMNTNRNIAISKCFQKKLINSTSIMPNMPGFEEAVLLAKKYNFINQLGLHASITEGKPLTDLSKTTLIDEKGFFIPEKVYKPTVFFSRLVRNKVKKEVEAQLDLVYQFGIQPTHINTHYDIHDRPWLLPIFFSIAKEHNIKLRVCVRKNGINPLKPFYFYKVNQILKSHNLDFSDYFVTVEDYKKDKLIKQKDKRIEIMVHPDLGGDDQITDSLDSGNLEKRLIELFNNNMSR